MAARAEPGWSDQLERRGAAYAAPFPLPLAINAAAGLDGS